MAVADYLGGVVMQRKSGLLVVGTLACILACPGEESVAHGDSPVILTTHYVNKSSVAVTVLPRYWECRENMVLYNKYMTELNNSDSTEKKKYTDYCTGIILEPGAEKTKQVLPPGDGLYIYPGRAETQQRSVTGVATLNELVPDHKTQPDAKQLLYVWHYPASKDEPHYVMVKPQKVACKKGSADGVEVDANVAVKVCLGPAKTEAESGGDTEAESRGGDGEIELLWRGDSPQCSGVDVRLTISRAALARLTGGSSSSSGGSVGGVMGYVESLKNCSSSDYGQYMDLKPEKGMTDMYVIIEDVK